MAAPGARRRPRCPTHRPLEPAAPWVELVATDADWDAADPDLLRTMLGQLVLIRAFEEYVLELAGAGPDPRPRALQHRPGGRRGRLGARADQRGHGQRLAPRPPPVPRQGAAPRRRRRASTRRRRARRRRARRCCCARWPRSAGSTAGFSHGRGGSMHLQWKEAGAMGTNAIVGGGVPLAAGFAWAHRQAGTDAVVGDLLRRRRHQHRLHAGDVQPRRRLAAAGLLLHREQPVRGVHQRRTRRPASRGCPPAARASASPAGGSTGWTRWPSTWRCSEARRAHARRPRPDADRGRHLPATSTRTAPFPGSAFRLPHQGGGGGVAGARPDRPDRAPSSSAAASSTDERGRQRSPRPRRLHGRDRRRAARAAARRQARPAADQAGGVARPGLRRRRRARRPVASSTTRRWSTDDAFGGELAETKFIDAVAGGDAPADGDRRRASSSWARTCTGSTAAPTAPPAA